jgi:hypothetical protein
LCGHAFETLGLAFPSALGNAPEWRTAPLVSALHARRVIMGIVLRWLEEPFECELVTRAGGRTLVVTTTEGHIVWEEPVASASAACDRAREIRDRLAPGGRKRA